LTVGQLAAAFNFEPTFENVLLVVLPKDTMAVKQTTTIKANITAYSTAVGPSSFFMNRIVARPNAYNMLPSISMVRGPKCRRVALRSASNQLAAADNLPPMVEKVVLAVVPKLLIATKQTTMMSANMTAYSTAVGPSSFLRKLTAIFANRFMTISPNFGDSSPG
jgi:hypothetical protein